MDDLLVEQYNLKARYPYSKLTSKMRYLTALFVTISCVSSQAFASALPPHLSAKGKWTPLAPIAGFERQEFTTVALNSTNFYVLGGILPELNGQVFPTVTLMQTYSIPRNKWTTVAPVPVALNHPNAAVVDGKIYLLGGLTPGDGGLWVASSACYVYDPRKDQWTKLPAMPNGRGSAAVGVNAETIYLAGGLTLVSLGPDDREDTVNTTSSYNTKTKIWKTLPALPQPRDHAGVAVIDQKYYVLGGRAFGHDYVVDTVFGLDLCNISAGWYNRAKMITARGGVASAVLNGLAFVVGGEGNYDVPSGVYNQTEAYNPATNKWTKYATMTVPRHGSAAVSIGGKIYIAGGGTVKGGMPSNYTDYFSL